MIITIDLKVLWDNFCLIGFWIKEKIGYNENEGNKIRTRDKGFR